LFCVHCTQYTYTISRCPSWKHDEESINSFQLNVHSLFVHRVKTPNPNIYVHFSKWHNGQFYKTNIFPIIFLLIQVMQVLNGSNSFELMAFCCLNQGSPCVCICGYSPIIFTNMLMLLMTLYKMVCTIIWIKTLYVNCISRVSISFTSTYFDNITN
jgi:hypothetical protein